MPLLFAVTLFVSAALLFMVQPMVGKLVLPLLGGSPAVWNACMVFFQALLLLGYLYADRLTRKPDTRKQWVIHLGVMTLPVAAFALAILFSSRHTPIAVAESLAPTGGSSAILSVLAILTVAIGVPFFVVSTSATLLQKWFTYTGHPSARDPYFLYTASNAGSLISLLGYPIFIEPNMTQGNQTWFWAVGFVALFGLIAFCGRAAANPLGVPPGGDGKQPGGKQGGANKQAAHDNKAIPVAPPTEAPPSWLRMAKWTTLAFVPSSLMLGVTFHMTTDIASIPLLWVVPLALYLLTFIIAFGRVPAGFRILIGNLAPVMILLLVFVLISGVTSKQVGLSLLLHLLTFFAAALMCHYELARDRPAPQYLTTYFLIMSLGGVLGGVFNSLLAPVVFPLAYEYPLAIIIACLMVPRLTPEEAVDADGTPAPAATTGSAKAGSLAGLASSDDFWVGVVISSIAFGFGLCATLPVYTLLTSLLVSLGLVVAFNALYLFAWKPLRRGYLRLPARTRERMALALDIVIPVLIGLAYWQLQKLPATSDWYGKWLVGSSQGLSKLVPLGTQTIMIVIACALPVMICFFFVDRPLRFALSVAAILGPTTYKELGAGAIYTERSFFGILKVEETLSHQYLMDRSQFFKFTDEAAAELRKAKVPDAVIQKLEPIKDRELRRDDFEAELAKLVPAPELAQYRDDILKGTVSRVNSGENAVRRADGVPVEMGHYEYRRLVHGTTLHGTQVARHDRHVLDDFQLLTVANPWENLAVAGAITAFDMRQEPLTYYHRTGPVGAMFDELKRRGKEKEPVAMVGLGTGSVACYAQKGQKLTFYEIDPTVRRLVEEPWKVMNEQDVRERGCAPIKDPKVRKLVDKLGGVNVVGEAEYDEKLRAYRAALSKHETAMRAYLDDLARRKAAGEPTDDVRPPEEPAKPPAVPEVGPFTFVDDARNRGAEVDFRMGDARLMLKQDTDRKYRLLLVDAFSSDSIPVHLLTNEAVGLYLDRITDDGILALHISNKFVRLEPVVAAIARHHNLVARVWNDDSEGRPGKTASSWVVLARTREALGDRLCSPISDFMIVDTDDGPVTYPQLQLLDLAKRQYPDLASALRSSKKPPKQVALEWLGKRTADPQALAFARWIRKYGEHGQLMKVLQEETGYGFRPLDLLAGVDAWTDDYADVMRVMMIPELQAVRKFFGLPTPVER